MDWVFLTQLYREAPVPLGWLSKQFQKSQFIDYSPLPKVVIRSETSTLSLASLGKVYDPPRAVNVVSNVTETMIDPPQIYEYDIITEEMAFAKNYNPQIVAANGTTTAIRNSIDYFKAKKIETLKARVQNRLEWMYAQILSNGELVYNDNDRAYSVTFGVTPASYTLQNSTKVVSDLRDLVMELKASGFSPSFILVTPSVERKLWDNTQFSKAVEQAALGVGVARFEAEPFANMVAQIQDLPPIFVYSATVGGTSFIPGNKIVIVGDGAIRTAYGAILNSNLTGDWTPIVTDVAVWEKVSEDGSALNLYVLSRPLPYLVSAKGLKILNVSIS